MRTTRLTPLIALALALLVPAVARAQDNPWHDVDPRYDVRDVSTRAFIEISKGSKDKNEIDKTTGKIKLDRVIKYHSGYPANYGFIPRSFAGDGDPLDVLVLGDKVLQPGAMVEVRVIGVIRMEDQGEADDKLIAVEKGDPKFERIRDIRELPAGEVERLAKFFREYKVAENKIVRVRASEGRASARSIVSEAFKDYDAKFRKPAPAPAPAPAKTGFFASVGEFFKGVGAKFGSFFRVERPASRGMTDVLKERVRERGVEGEKSRVR